MEKNLQQNKPVRAIRDDSPGRMWGVLQILKYHQWRRIRKRIPGMKGVSPKHSTRVGKEEHYINVSKNEKIPQPESTRIGSPVASSLPMEVDEKTAQSAPVNKGSLTSRIKARLSDELHKRKGRHRRSSSSPELFHLQRTDSIHCLDPADEYSLNNRRKTAEDVNFPATTLPDPQARRSFKVSKYENCNATLTNIQLGQNHIDDNGKHFIENHILIPENSDSRRQSLVHGKEMLDALDFINTNKEFLLKFLHDSSSPLAHHFHSQLALSSKRVFYKSASFTSPSSSCVRGSSPGNHKQKGIDSETIEPPKSKAFIRSSSMPSVAPEYGRTNQIVMKRFKDLKQKIRHIINQNNNEKRRIAMDGVLHKIPPGHELPKDLKKDIDDHMKTHSSRDVKKNPKSTDKGDNSLPSTSKSESCCFSVGSSLSDSLDRYSQLYESCSNKESKQTSKLRSQDVISPQRSASKTIRRMLSSPDLKYYCNLTEDSSNACSSNEVRNALDTTISSEQLDTEIGVGNDIQQNLDTGKHTVDEDQKGITTASNVEPEDDSDLACDYSSLGTSNDVFHEQNAVPPSEIVGEPEKPNITVMLDSKFSERPASPCSPSVAEGTRLPDRIDSLENQAAESIKDTPGEVETKVAKMEIPSKNLKLEMGDKDKAEFDYVREILQLSGFSGSELLGTWHSDDQPLDPSMLEEMEGSMPSYSECFGNEEGYPCYHLLLFDLINQALMEIDAKSHSYYLSPLSPLSHIHRMPVGHHVLEEVWANVSWYLSSSPEADQLLDYIVSRDLSKYDGWMNLQFDCECVAIEVEDLIFDDLMDDMIFDDFLE